MRAVASAVLALLSNCAGLEPYDRPNVWRATGINDSNLAAMAVRPADLARGRGTGPTDGQVVAAAVDRLRSGRVKPLADGAAGGASSGVAGGAALTGN
jgi:type IV pilus biogenesis protein CpaD/CtpE